MKVFQIESLIRKKFDDRRWSHLKRAIRYLLKKNSCRLSFEDLYSLAYKMVSHREGERLYSGLRETCIKHLETNVRVDVLNSLNNDNFLQTLIKAWNDYQRRMSSVCDALLYLDRIYVQKYRGDNLHDLKLILFRDQIIRHERIRDHLRETLIDMVMRDRRGEIVDRSAMKSAFEMLVQLGVRSRSVFEEIFERPFLSKMVEFYRVKSQEFLVENNISVYIRKVEACIDKESARPEPDYFDRGIVNNILEVVGRELISHHMNSIVEMENSGVIYMLKNHKVDNLARVYNLFSRIPDALKMMFDYISKYFQERGESFLVDDLIKSIILCSPGSCQCTVP